MSVRGIKHNSLFQLNNLQQLSNSYKLNNSHKLNLRQAPLMLKLFFLKFLTLLIAYIGILLLSSASTKKAVFRLLVSGLPLYYK